MYAILDNSGSAAGSLPPLPSRSFWEQCGTGLSSLVQLWRGTSVLALGESFSAVQAEGKSAQIVQRLRTLNPALRIESQCGPALGLLEAGVTARSHARHSFDAALVFMGPAQLANLESQEDFIQSAEQAIVAIRRAARSAYLVAAFGAGESQGACVATPQIRIAARRRRWLERTLQTLCDRHGVTWVPLTEEEGCLPAAGMPAFNFSVDGFRPSEDPHEMWTARMLQQPALAHLVFH